MNVVRGFGIAMAFFFGWCLAFYLPGCGTLKQDEAALTYGGQLQSCVDRYSTREGIDSCRAEVNKNWGRLPDGGKMSDAHE